MQIISEIAEIIASAADGGLVLYFFVQYFGKKDKIRWWEYVIWMSAFFVDAHFLNDHANVQACIMIILVWAFSIIYLKGKNVVKLIATLIIYILMAFINIGSIQIVALCAGTPIGELIIPGTTLRIIVLCISKITLGVIFYLVEKFLNREHYIKKEEGILLIALYAIFFIVALISIKIIVTVKLDNHQQMSFFALSMAVFLINIFLFWMVEKMNYHNRCEVENEILKVQLEQQEKQICHTELLYQNARKIRHDMKHYFMTYLELLKAGEVKIVIDEMQEILKTELKVENIFYMNSRMVNAVINQKAALCKNENIPFDVQITGDFQWHQESNVAILLSNLLDNAIEAEKLQTEKQQIALKMFVYKDSMNIIVENYIQESVLQKNPNLKTSKHDKWGHGIGIDSVKELVRREDGTIAFFEEKDNFVAHVMIPCVMEQKDCC